MDTVQSLYNTPCYNMDLDIMCSSCGSQLFCSLDPDQVGQNVRQDLDSNCWVY